MLGIADCRRKSTTDKDGVGGGGECGGKSRTDYWLLRFGTKHRVMEASLALCPSTGSRCGFVSVYVSIKCNDQYCWFFERTFRGF